MSRGAEFENSGALSPEAIVLAQAEDAGATLHPWVETFLARPNTPYGEFTPKNTMHRRFVVSGIEKAMAISGHILRKEPATELVDTPLEIPDHAPALARFMLTTLSDSYVRPERSIPTFPSERGKDIGACQDAEPSYIEMLDPKLRYKSYYPINVVIGDEGKPVLIEKTYGQDNSLSLSEVSINAVRFPAGSLLNAVLDHTKIKASYKNSVDRRVKIYGTDAVRELSFARLTPWALTGDERTEYLAEHQPEILEGTRLTDTYLPEATLDALGTELVREMPDL